jgi:hypothetical protein
MRSRIFFLILTIITICCGKKAKIENDTEQPKTSNLSGKELSLQYCGSCHSYPEPSLLDSITWKADVLPKMYQRLGLEKDNFVMLSELSNDDLPIIANASIYPEKPLITIEDWKKIEDFYLLNSPQKLPKQESKNKIAANNIQFKIKPIFCKKDQIPAVTLVKFDPSNNQFYLGIRGNSSYLSKYDKNLKQIDSISLASPVADLIIKNSSINILTMGKMDPNDQKKGELLNFDLKNKKQIVIKNQLQRPVNINFADLNNDKIDDYIICQFGNELGKLSWINGKTKEENILNEFPGARNTVLYDINNDGFTDITVLMTQANEQIVSYLNNGKGDFEEKVLLRFPPVYGSTYFQFVDFNKDGFQDILYTNGDNADLSIILKPYHGIRIFLNDGKNNFKQSYFYPMHGASKAIASDFDHDGDLDIAAISFFTDPNQKPNEGFLYFQNKRDNQIFNVSTVNLASKGKWMVMDVADMDNDGDDDIILGSFLLKEPYNTSVKSNIAALILENRLK